MPTGDSKKSDAEKIVIKKYANRRLYNTAKSSYVTLDDLAKMVRAGQDFSVYDAKSGDDITRSVLTQIIFEEEAKGDSMLPTNFLRQLIALYGGSLQGVVPNYLEAAMETFSQNQEKMRQVFGAAPPVTSLETMARGNMEWFEKAMQMFSPFGAGMGAGLGQDSNQSTGASDPSATPGPGPDAGPGPKPEEKPATDRGKDLDLLQRQLSEMQAQLERLTGGKT